MRGSNTRGAERTPIDMPQTETRDKIEDRPAAGPVAQDGQNGHGQDRREWLGQRVQHYYIRSTAESEPGQEGFVPAPVLAGLGISAGAGALLGLLVGILLFNAEIVIPGWEVLFATRDDIMFHALWVLIGLSAGVLAGAAVVILTAPDHS